MRTRRVFEEKLNLPLATSDPYSNSATDDSEEYMETGLLDDFQLVRKTLRSAIRTNKDIIETIKDELQADPNPRLAEVSARLLESLTNTSLQLIQASKTIAEIYQINKSKDTEDSGNKQTNFIQNAILVGSLEEALKLGKKEQPVLSVINNSNEGNTTATDPQVL